MVCHFGFHRRSDAQGLVNPAEVVVHEVKRNGGGVVLDLLGKPIRQARKPAHVHPHGEVLALCEVRPTPAISQKPANQPFNQWVARRGLKN